MVDREGRWLESFAAWLKDLGQDAAALAAVVADGDVPVGAREAAASGVNYLFKSVDLIPDGIDEVGYLDDAFVLRVAAALALRESAKAGTSADLGGVLRLAEQCDDVREFLGSATFGRLEGYVRALGVAPVRGRVPATIVGEEGPRRAFLADAGGFESSYVPPVFAQEAKSLIKLRAFLEARLPR